MKFYKTFRYKCQFVPLKMFRKDHVSIKSFRVENTLDSPSLYDDCISLLNVYIGTKYNRAWTMNYLIILSVIVS